LTLAGFASTLLQVAAEMCLKTNFNPLGDPALVCILLLMGLSLWAIHKVCFWLADRKFSCFGGRWKWDGLWQVKEPPAEGGGMMMMDEVADDRARRREHGRHRHGQGQGEGEGEGEGGGMERETRPRTKEEWDAVNNHSSTFRRQFVKENKPWILRHLVELMTKEALYKMPAPLLPGSEEEAEAEAEQQQQGGGRQRTTRRRRLLDYAREIYGELLRMETEGEEEEEKALTETSAAIAHFWLSKARMQEEEEEEGVEGKGKEKEIVAVDESTRALAIKWLCLAQETTHQDLERQGVALCEALEVALERIKKEGKKSVSRSVKSEEEEEEGLRLLEVGQELANDRHDVQGEWAVRQQEQKGATVSVSEERSGEEEGEEEEEKMQAWKQRAFSKLHRKEVTWQAEVKRWLAEQQQQRVG
jgi:hypothetical protein